MERLGLPQVLSVVFTEPGVAPPTATAAASGPALDNSAWLACRQYSFVQRDAGAGILTDAELRAAIRRVYDKAKVTDSEVTEASAALLAVLTRGEAGQPLAEAVVRLNGACDGWETRNR